MEKKRFTIQIQKEDGIKTYSINLEPILYAWLEKQPEEKQREYVLFIKEQQRSNQRQITHNLSYETFLERGIDPEELNEKETEPSQYELLHLETCIACLSPKQQELIQEIFYGGKSEVEYAKEKGIGKAAVCRMYKRALEKLRKLY